MAQKFGGQHSPTGADPISETARDERIVDAAGGRANLLFLPALLLAVTSFFAGPTLLAIGLIGAGLLTAAAWLLREGLRAEAAYNARQVARRPAIPRKMMASALTGIGVALAAYTGDNGLIGSALYGIIAGGLHVAAFGIDPLKNKRMEGIDTFQQDRVARVVDKAEAHLATMKEQIETLKDRALDLRIDGFQSAARRMIRTVEQDPRDLTRARKYLGVYLMGARDASIKFAALYGRTKNASARADYESLLTDLEQNFAALTEKMLLDDKSDMDIEIKVLRARLQQEGVTPKEQET